MARLPPELVDHLFAYLCVPDDSPALCSCSLVCSEWLPIARAHLFGTVHLHEARVSYARKDLLAFLDILRASPGVGLSVKQLHVRSQGRRTTLSFRNLILVLQQLPHLQRIVLSDVYLPGTFPDHRLGPIPCSSLEKLSLVNVVNPSQSIYRAATIFHFLRLFSRIREVDFTQSHLFSNTLSTSFDALLVHFPFPARLNTSKLTLGSREHDNATFLRMLQTTHVMETLQELKIIIRDPFFFFAPFKHLTHGPPNNTIHTFTIEIDLSPHFIFSRTTLHITNAVRPALRSLHLLRTFHLILRPIPIPADSWNLSLAQLRALPSGVQDLHVYAHAISPSCFAQMGEAVDGCAGLKNVYVHLPPDAQVSRWDVPGRLGPAVVHLVDWLE